MGKGRMSGLTRKSWARKTGGCRCHFGARTLRFKSARSREVEDLKRDNGMAFDNG